MHDSIMHAELLFKLDEYRYKCVKPIGSLFRKMKGGVGIDGGGLLTEGANVDRGYWLHSDIDIDQIVKYTSQSLKRGATS